MSIDYLSQNTAANQNTALLEAQLARIWDMPDVMVEHIEGPRRPFDGPLSKIVGKTFAQHIPEDVPILELGAGSGYLKEIMPDTHTGRLISTDYNIRNLQLARK